MYIFVNPFQSNLSNLYLNAWLEMVKTFLEIQLRHYGYQQSTIKSDWGVCACFGG